MPLTGLLDGELARIQAKSGIYVKHLRSGEEAMVRADEPFDSASTIKLATLVLGYQMAGAGTLKLDERVEITPANTSDLNMRPSIRSTENSPMRMSSPSAARTRRSIECPCSLTKTTGVTNDVGVICSGTGPILIAFYNMSMTSARAEIEDAMGRVAQSVDYFNGHNQPALR